MSQMRSVSIMKAIILSLALNAACRGSDHLNEVEAATRRGDYEEAFAILRKPAADGNALAQLELGKIYARHAAEAQDVPIDYDVAIRWFRSAAEQGLAEAQHQLGLIYDPTLPESAIPDADEALKWYSLAAENDFADAQYSLGGFYDEWNASDEDLRLAAAWYRKATEQGHDWAAYQLGLMYERGRGVVQDLMEAERLFKMAADLGNRPAQLELGSLLSVRDATATADEDDRLAGLRFAAEELGYAESQYSLGDSYENGYNVPTDLSEAVRLYRMAADNGLADAQHALCRLFYLGNGVAPDLSRSYDWCLSAAEQGHAGASDQLGFLYSSGTYVDQDDEEAVKWFSVGADAGHVDSQFHLAVMYAEGRGVSKSDEESVKWLRLAATRGHAAAQRWLGSRYRRGVGVPQDNELAFLWYEYAARNGDPDPLAQYELALAYRDGMGVAVDRMAMMRWLQIAVGNGNAEAAEELRTMFTVLNDSCAWANDGECDEPHMCAVGTDDTDCKIVRWVHDSLRAQSPSVSSPDFEIMGSRITCEPANVRLVQRTEHLFTGWVNYLFAGEDPYGNLISDEYSCDITLRVDGASFSIGWPNRDRDCPMAHDKSPLERSTFQEICYRPQE